MFRITFIAAHSHLFNRLPEIFQRPGVHITVIGCPSTVLATSPFVDRFIPVGAHAEKETFVSDLIESGVLNSPDVLGDWVIIAGDDELRELAQSDLPEEVLVRLLSATTPSGRASLGSKVGMAHLSKVAGVQHPRTLIARYPDELPKILESFPEKFVVKADIGGAGLQVRIFSDAESLAANPIPTEWFPIIVQEFVEGTLVSVEALFKSGELLGYQYSVVEAVAWERGPTCVRRYHTPPSGAVDGPLQALARVSGANGLSNCTFIRSLRTGNHLLIEADFRPNVHCQFASQLGLDWVELMLNPPTAPVFPQGLPPQGEIIRLYPTDITRALAQRSFRELAPWLFRAPGTWDTRNRRDPTANAAERRQTYKGEIAPTLLKLWHKAPTPVRATVNQLGLRKAARWLITSDPETNSSTQPAAQHPTP